MNKRDYDVLLTILIVAAVAIAGILLYWIFRSSGGGGSVIPPTAAPPITDDSWSQIQAAGNMVVGTSLDYPPFAYYNDQFQPDGFDIALIREVVQRLGVRVELRDMAFDGLGGALLIGQIDAAIGAISVTPERESQVRFSSVYYVSEDAVLARQDSPITNIQTVEQMAGQRIGVQRGSVYETWLQTTLVETGLTSANNLFVYETADAAVRDLREQRIDLVVGDLLPAETAVSQGGVKLVGRGLNLQRYAIAMAPGSAALQAEINRALLELQNSGRLNQLIQQYLGIPPEEVIPPPTPTATPVATPQPTATTPFITPSPTPCIDGMRYVADLNLDDRNMTAPPVMNPGQGFQKGWRIQNSGSCPWNTAYRLVYVAGNSPEARMGGQPTPIQAIVSPGQQYDIFVNLIAPLTPGTYQGFWQMTNDRGVPFGDRIWVGIQVPAPPTATPPPTQTPSPNISFTVDRTSIRQGECVTFSWSATNVSAVYFYANGEAWQNNQVPAQGNRVVCPPTTTTYNLRVVKPDGTVEVRQIAITVQPAIDAPVIRQFAVNPPQITVGQCVTIQWQVEGNVNRVTLYSNGVPIWDGAPLRGNLQNCPPGAGTIEYSVQAVGPGGTSRAQEYVNVVNPATATAVPTPIPEAPRIDAFSVNPTQIEVNQCVLVTWATSGGTSQVQLKRNGAIVIDNAQLAGSAQDCLSVAGTVVYRLEARSANGQLDSRELAVIVTEAPPQNPLANTSWNLIGLNNEGLIFGSIITITFTDNGQVNGSGGCNTYQGRYTVNGTSISISDISQTQQLCAEPAGIMEQEAAYFRALSAAFTFELPPESTNLLIIRDNRSIEILRYVRN